MTPRQKQIITLLALGMNNKEIAIHLGISDNTVKMHLRTMFMRFSVNSRAKLVAKLYVRESHYDLQVR